MTNTEINEQVARKLGWTRCNDEDQGEIRWHTDMPSEPGTFGGQCRNNLPDYAHSIQAAWELTQTNYPFGLLYQSDKHDPLRRYWECWFGSLGQCRAEADTAALAICLAFLKLP